MASAVTKTAGTNSILTPSITLKGHWDKILSISYFPDGQRMISGSCDTTVQQWDLKTGKEIVEARSVCEEMVRAVEVSRNGRWVAIGSGGDGGPELKACEVETGIVKTFKGHSREWITCIDISADNTRLASGSNDRTARIWNLDTGKLVAGPFKSEEHSLGAVRFSPDSKKLAVVSWTGRCLELWDIQSQKLDVKVGEFYRVGWGPQSEVFWTNKNKNIIAVFRFTAEDDDNTTIYEFDGSTLETVGTPFKGHTFHISGLALSFDDALLATASLDKTVKLWAFESRQLLASFDVQHVFKLVLSPDARQLAYTTLRLHDSSEDSNRDNICICDTPPEVLAQARNIARKKSNLDHLLHSRATRRPAGHRRPPIYAIPTVQRPPPSNDSQQPSFLRLSKFLRFSPRTNTVRPGQNDQPHDPLDFSATSPLPRPLSGHTSTQGRSDMNPGENVSTTPFTTISARIHNVLSWRPVHGGHAKSRIVDVPLAQAKERNAAAGAPKKDEDIVPDEYLDPPSPNPDSQQPATAVQPGEHGGDRSCFCF